MNSVSRLSRHAVGVIALAVGTFGLLCLTQRSGLGQSKDMESPVFRVEVELVVLNVTVTDRRGRHIQDLKPSDFQVYEDGIGQTVSSFAEGNVAPRRVARPEQRPAEGTSKPEGGRGGVFEELGGDDTFAGTNVFILFDTSNFMYRSFVFAEDAIADFIRGLDSADSVAVYGYSRNLTRHAPMSDERLEAIKGLRMSVAGDETALYNSLLLTLRDAATVAGRKVVIVFSNGPDTASTVGPDDVRAIAEDEGVPIYVISTREVNKDPISSNVFSRLTARTGGRAFFAKSWQKQSEAFVNIREELSSSYTLTYYPKANPNQGWRSIKVELQGDQLRKYRVRTRSGYRPKL